LVTAGGGDPAAAAAGPAENTAGSAVRKTGVARRAPVPPAPVGLLAVRSLDDACAFARALGNEPAPFLSTRFLESKLGFLSPGDLLSNRPVGVVLFAAPGMRLQESSVFVLPVRPGTVALEDFTARGGMRVDGHPDTVVTGAGPLRRTRDSVIFGARPDAVVALDPGTLARATSNSDTLVARAYLDLAVLRRTVPRDMNAFCDGFEAGFVRGASGLTPGPERFDRFVGSEERAARAAAQALTGPFRRTLGKLNLEVHRGGGNVRFAFTMQPVTLPPMGNFQQPGLPGECTTRLDLAFAPRLIYNPWGESASDPSDAESAARANSPVDDLVRHFAGSDALTVGVYGGPQPAVYAVLQYKDDVRFIAGLDAFVARTRARAQRAGQESPVDYDTYNAANGATVWRLTFDAGTARQTFVDVIQRGRVVYVAMSDDAERRVERLPGLAPLGPMRCAFSGSSDLDAAMSDSLRSPASNLSRLTPAQLKGVRSMLAGQKLMFSVANAGDAVTVDLSASERALVGLARVGELTKARPVAPRGQRPVPRRAPESADTRSF
jgi:hypothetical protein